MVNTVFILDKNRETSKILSINKHSQNIFWDDTYQLELATGSESFEFSCYADERVVEGNFVAFYYNQQYKMFTIMEVEEEHSEGQIISHCYCEISSMELLNQYVRAFSGDMNCLQFFTYILDNTGWQIGRYNTSLENKVATIDISKAQSVWSLIEDYKDIFECEINVRVTYENGKITGQLIDLYAEGGMGTPTFKRFEYGRNVVGITKTKDLYDWATGLIVDVEGVNDVTFSKKNGDPFDKAVGDVILDPTNNEIYNGGRGYIMGVYQGEEKDPRAACLDAWKELQKRAVPKFDYEVTTALTSDEYDNIHLGDTVYVVDYGYTPALLLEARVGELHLSFTDRTQNKCILTNYKEVKSRLLGADYIKLTGTITDVVNAFFPIGSDGIADGAIVDGKIDTVYYEEITTDIVSAGIGVFENLYAEGLTVVNADVENLRAQKADIAELNATNATVGTLSANVASISTLVNGNLSSDNIQSLILTSDKVTVADAFIKNAMIDTISASKINTGTINTNNVQIQSSDGSMIINGTTQQFKDKNGKVRIQIGKDAQGNFTFSLFDANGTGVLINQDGVKSGAIADGLIVNKMVADNANISGSKLDINSVVSSINNGTSTIKGTKVKLDDTNQTLDVAFNSLGTKIDNIEIGGRNLYIKTKEFSTGDLWINNVHWNLTNETYNGCVVRKRVNAWGGIYQKTPIEMGEYYTLSAWIKGDKGGGICAYGKTGYDVVDTNFVQGEAISTTWKRYWAVFRANNDIDALLNQGRFENNKDTAMYICGLKFEKGNKATDWSPAPEDAEEKITSNTTSISAQQGQINTLISNTTITKSDGSVVQLKDDYNSTKSTVSGHTTTIGSLTTSVNNVSSKQTTLETNLNGFKTTVSDTYATKSALNTTNSNVSSISSKQSTLETNLNNFKTTVSNTYETKTNVSNTYATKTSLTQTANDFTFKVQESGGYNLLRNSNFANGTTQWGGIDGKNTLVADATALHNATKVVRIIGSIGTTRTVSQGVTGLNIKSPVTVSFYRHLSSGSEGTTNPYMHVQFVFTYTDDTKSYHGITDGGDRETNVWKRFSAVVYPTSGKTAKAITVDCFARDTSRTVHYGNLMVQTGQTLSPWSPNPNEVKDGIVTINNNGITVTHGNDKSVLNSDALNFYEGSVNYSKIKGGKFQFTNDSGTNVGFVGRNLWSGTNTYLNGLNATYGHVSALCAQKQSGGNYIAGLCMSSKSQTVTSDGFYLDTGVCITAPIVSSALWIKPDNSAPIETSNGVQIGALYLQGAKNDNGLQRGVIAGNSELYVGVLQNATVKAGMKFTEGAGYTNSVKAEMWTNLYMNGNTTYNSYSINTLSAQSDYTRRLLNGGSNENFNHGTMTYNANEIRWCWKETVFTYPEADIDPETDEWVYTGRNICYIELPIFMAENIQKDYHVNIGKMSWGDYRIIERNQYYFILESQEEDFAFTFEVVGQLNDNQTLSPNANIASSGLSYGGDLEVVDREALLENDSIRFEPPVGDDIQENIITGEG